MSDKLATFRTDSDIWAKFQAKAKGKGTNASALLQRFLRDYLDDNLDNRIDTPAAPPDVDIKAMIATAIYEQLTDIKERILEEHGAGVRGISTSYEALLEDVQKDVNDLTVSFSKDMIAIDDRFEALEAIATAKKPLMQIAREKQKVA